MVSILDLWLPIVLSAVLVFFASSLLWMALPFHKNDFKFLGGEEANVMNMIRGLNLSGGIYMFPRCDPKAVKDDPAAAERLKTGPWGMLTVMASPGSMGKCLGLWMLNTLLVAAFVAYIASNALPAGAEYLKVFQIVGATTFLAYGGNALCDSIWKGRPWSHLPGNIIDALIYALLTGGAFGWLWPKAAAILPVMPS